MSSGIVIRNQFVNQQSPGRASGGGVQRFIMNYMLRGGAVEPVVADSKRNQLILQRVADLKAPEDADALKFVNHQLQFDGVGFTLTNPAMSRKEMNAVAQDAQAAFTRGGTVKQMVLSFDTKWLQDHGVLSSDVTEPVSRGDLRNQVDQLRLREATQAGIQAMLKKTRMKDPRMAAAIQTDTAHVHVHLCLWDHDPTVVNDRGRINGYQKDALAKGLTKALDESQPSFNHTQMLQSVAEVTQGNARFKVKTLEQQLYQSAMQLDRDSLQAYIGNLAEFDGRTLSERQREHLEARIKKDYEQYGEPVQRPQAKNPGQKRGRRLLTAERRATALRQAQRGYNQQASQNRVAKASLVVKQALDYEFQRQQMVVAKYRAYGRIDTQRIYTRHKDALLNQRQVLLQKRQATLKALGGYYVRPVYLKRLLKDSQVRQGLQEDSPTESVLQSSAYQQLHQAMDDGYTPLSEATIKAVTKHLPPEDADQTTRILRQNQQTPAQADLGARQRQLLYQYLEDYDEYQAAVASLGGLNPDRQLDSFTPGEPLPEPTDPAGVYERNQADGETQTPDLLAVDAHQILRQGQFKPQITVALGRQIQKRQRLLMAADQYFRDTAQTRPEWLTNSMRDFIQQRAMYERSTGLEVPRPEPVPTEPEEQTGYELSAPVREQLVQKHLKDLQEMVR